MPRFSAHLGFLFPEHAFVDRFAAAAAAGFAGIEIGDPYSHPLGELKDKLDAHHLSCVLINFPPGPGDRQDRGFACHPGSKAAFVAGTRAAIAAARTLGCPRLHCTAGRRTASGTPHELRRALIENLRYAAAACADEGLTLLLEPLSTLEVPDLFLDHWSQALEVLDAVRAPNLLLQLDLYHLYVTDGPEGLLETLDALLPRTGHIQFADYPGRHEPGTGLVPLEALFARIDAGGYPGWVGAEYRPTRPTAQTLGYLRGPSL